jgi:hypothetical protein
VCFESPRRWGYSKFDPRTFVAVYRSLLARRCRRGVRWARPHSSPFAPQRLHNGSKTLEGVLERAREECGGAPSRCVGISKCGIDEDCRFWPPTVSKK